MKLKEIYFGKVDAKNELTEDSEEQKDAFEQAYLLPESVDFSSIISGEKYIIYGLKGIGKTALLRYIDIQMRKEQKNNTSFILFKSDFSAEDKSRFNSRSKCMVNEEEIKEYGDMRDYEAIWKWFFFTYIHNCIKDTVTEYFEDDSNWKRFEKCVQCLNIAEDPLVKGIGRFLPRIKKGQATITQPGYAIEVGIDVGSSQKIQFGEIVHKAEQYFNSLKPAGEKELYLLVDELEIAFETKKFYERDIRIIRDLIVVVEKLNAWFRKNNYRIKIIVSIRSEILNVVNAIGKEINKCVEDFGVQIIWHQSGGSEHDHPLLQMIMKRLVVAEQLEDTKENREHMWRRFFPDDQIQGKSVERYILHNSWYRPRDIVRMLSKGKNMFPNKEQFDHQVFDGIRKAYSADAWTECMEELKASYGNDQINSIENIFNGWKAYFSRKDIEERIKSLSRVDDRLVVFSKNSTKLLEDLYRVGVIGNSYREYKPGEYKIRFIFRGDYKLLPEKDMMIHNALRPHFSL